MFRQGFVIGLALFCVNAFSQNSKVTIEGGQPIDPKRYADIKDSPYFFKDWVVGTVIASSLEKFEDVWVNYNGHTQDFEVKNGDKFIELDERRHKRVEILLEKNPGKFKDNSVEKWIFMSGIHEAFQDKYALLVYTGKSLVFLKDFSTGISEKTFQDVGRTVNVKRFNQKEDLYFLIDGELILFKLKKKTILEVLPEPYKSKAETFVESHKSKLDSEEEVVALLKFLEQ